MATNRFRLEQDGLREYAAAPGSPMLWQRVLTYLFWIAPAVLQMILLRHMLRTRLHSQLRVFFGYTAFSVARAAVLFWTYHAFGGSSKPYFVLYWSTALVDTVLVLAVIREIYAQVLHHYEGLKALSNLLFRWAFIILMIVAAMNAVFSPAQDSDRIIAGILMLDRTAILVQVGLLMLLFALASWLALTWKHYVFGVAVGMCLFSAVELVALTMRTHFGLLGAGTYALVKSGAYTCGVLVWVVFLLRRECVTERPTGLPSLPLEQFNAAIVQFLNRSS